MNKSTPIRTHYDASPSRRVRLVDIRADICSQPSCDAPAFSNIATQTPLCEAHIFDVYKAANQLLAHVNPRHEEYALLPSEQQQVRAHINNVCVTAA